MLKKFIIFIITMFLVLINTGINAPLADNSKYVRVVEDTEIYRSLEMTSSNIIALAKRGDVFKCVSSNSNYSVIIMFSGKGRYIDSSNVYPIIYTYNLPKKEICQEISLLIDQIIIDTQSQTKKITSNDNYEKIYDQLLDQNLLELFHLCKIMTCEYSQIVQASR